MDLATCTNPGGAGPVPAGRPPGPPVSETLDTNRCSWSDDADVEHVFGGLEGRAVRALSGPELALAPEVHRRSSSSQWRPLPTAPTPGTAPAGLRRCPDAPAGHGRPAVSDRHPAVIARRRRARARRRRIALGVSSGAVLVALALPWGGAGRHPLATPGPVLAGAAASPNGVYVVQPGDTMWTIAERLDPAGDPRPVVQKMEQEVGSDTLQPGERLQLP